MIPASGAWYVRKLGSMVTIEVVDGDESGGIAVDKLDFFDNHSGCLPECMKIVRRNCHTINHEVEEQRDAVEYLHSEKARRARLSRAELTST